MIVVVGDALLDRDIEGHSQRLCPDAPAPVLDDPVERVRPGGAGLAAALAAHSDRPVVLVTALGSDEPGRELASVLDAHGVEVVDLGLSGATPEKVRVRSRTHTLVRIDRGGTAPSRPGPLTPDAETALRSAAVVLVSDYGRGVAARDDVRAQVAALRRTPVVWDPHPRGPSPVAGVLLATPSEAEAEATDCSLAVTASRARHLAEAWSVRAVCITRGRRGALLVEGDGPPLAVPAPHVATGDPCGAGDRFASAAAVALAGGAVVSEAVTHAVLEASEFVAAGGAASVGGESHAQRRSQPMTAEEVVASVRTRGGVVVATGGCFDLLHAGHISLLAGARALGDCLVVCLNSDESVRRLKGDGRPVVNEHDRARVLSALASVDAVATFDGDTPVEVLERLRPDVFVKGGDYAGLELPEAEALAGWGGQVVVLPYVEGRSTTRLLEEVQRNARS